MKALMKSADRIVSARCWHNNAGLIQEDRRLEAFICESKKVGERGKIGDPARSLCERIVLIFAEEASEGSAIV